MSGWDGAEVRRLAAGWEIGVRFPLRYKNDKLGCAVVGKVKKPFQKLRLNNIV